MSAAELASRPDAATVAEGAAPVSWSCKACGRRVQPCGLHTCDGRGRVVDGHGTSVPATANTCAGAFVAPPRPGCNACGVAGDDDAPADLDHDQVARDV